jgi:hypothetical protein
MQNGVQGGKKYFIKLKMKTMKVIDGFILSSSIPSSFTQPDCGEIRMCIVLVSNEEREKTREEELHFYYSSNDRLIKFPPQSFDSNIERGDFSEISFHCGISLLHCALSQTHTHISRCCLALSR